MVPWNSWIINFLKRSPSVITKTQQLKWNLQVRRSLNLFDSVQQEMPARERLTQHILFPSIPHSRYHLNVIHQLHCVDLSLIPDGSSDRRADIHHLSALSKGNGRFKRDKSRLIPSFTDYPQQFSLNCSRYYQYLFFSKENKNKRWQNESCKRSLDQTDVSIGSHTSHVLSRILKVLFRDLPSFAMIIERPTVFS